jgi:hypothetical protein
LHFCGMSHDGPPCMVRAQTSPREACGNVTTLGRRHGRFTIKVQVGVKEMCISKILATQEFTR